MGGNLHVLLSLLINDFLESKGKMKLFKNGLNSFIVETIKKRDLNNQPAGNKRETNEMSIKMEPGNGIKRGKQENGVKRWKQESG